MPIDLSQVDWLYVVVLGISGLCLDPCRRRAVVWAPLDRRHALNITVRGAFRVLDLLPTPRTVVPENDHASECVDHDRRTDVAPAGRSCGAAEAEKSGHGHYAAQPGH